MTDRTPAAAVAAYLEETTAHRRAAARAALTAWAAHSDATYYAEHGEHGGHATEPEADSVVDLIADLLHLVDTLEPDAHSLEPNDVVDRALEHHQAEVEALERNLREARDEAETAELLARLLEEA